MVNGKSKKQLIFFSERGGQPASDRQLHWSGAGILTGDDNATAIHSVLSLWAYDCLLSLVVTFSICGLLATCSLFSLLCTQNISPQHSEDAFSY